VFHSNIGVKFIHQNVKTQSPYSTQGSIPEGDVIYCEVISTVFEPQRPWWWSVVCCVPV